MNIDYVRAITEEKIALRAVKDGSGGGHVGAMTGAIVATSLIFPAAPFFLFMHGKDITIPKGTELIANINGEIKLDPVNFTAKRVTPTTPTAAIPAPAPTAAVPSAPKGPKLTNADIIALKDDGFGDVVIISKIKA